MTPSLDKINRELKTVPKKTYDFFVESTPKQSGNARKKTKLKGDKIVAGYKYAKALDKGHSGQAPQGMTQPTAEYFKTLIRKMMRK